MNESKHIFKIVPGQQVTGLSQKISPVTMGLKANRISLVEENTLSEQKEVTLEPYFISYKVLEGNQGKFLSYMYEDNKGKVVSYDSNEVRVEWDDDNDEPRVTILLPSSYNSQSGYIDGEKVILPNSSLKFHMSNSQIKELLEHPNFFDFNGDETLVKTGDGKVICELSSTSLLIAALSLDPKHPHIMCASCNGAEYQRYPSKDYEYVTMVKDHENNEETIYFSDRKGNSIAEDDWNNQLKAILQKSKNLPDVISQLRKPVVIENLTDTQIENLVYHLTNQQLKVLTEDLDNNQLQTLAKHLTDSQLEALVDHLTNHQLQTFAQELNDTKLKIIIPILNEDQLAALVRGLNSGQLENILPHLKIDQFKVLINNIDDYQFMDLARNLSEHHLTILSKELGYNQLQILVNTLEEDKLKDLVNKLDHEKLTVMAQDLTDPSRIQIIIKSLAGNPEKLQTFANNMSDQQFSELLNQLNVEDLKDVIHKLPYEKVTAVIGQLDNKDLLHDITSGVSQKLREECGTKIEAIEKILEQMKEDMPGFLEAPDFTIVDSNKDSMLFI